MKKLKIMAFIAVCLGIICAFAGCGKKVSADDFLEGVDSVSVSRALTSSHVASLTDDDDIKKITDCIKGVTLIEGYANSEGVHEAAIICLQGDEFVSIFVYGDGSLSLFAYGSLTQYYAKAGAVDYVELYGIICSFTDN